MALTYVGVVGTHLQCLMHNILNYSKFLVLTIFVSLNKSVHKKDNVLSCSDMRDSMLGSKIDSHAIETYFLYPNSINIFQLFIEILSCHKEILNIKL